VVFADRTRRAVWPLHNGHELALLSRYLIPLSPIEREHRAGLIPAAEDLAVDIHLVAVVEMELHVFCILNELHPLLNALAFARSAGRLELPTGCQTIRLQRRASNKAMLLPHIGISHGRRDERVQLALAKRLTETQWDATTDRENKMATVDVIIGLWVRAM